VIVSPDEVPSVTITAPRAVLAGEPFATQMPLTLSGSAMSVRGRAGVRACSVVCFAGNRCSVNTSWSITPSIANSSISYSADASALSVQPNALTPGTTYTFTYSADDGDVGYASLQVAVDAGAVSGNGVSGNCTLQLALPLPTELDGSVSVQCLGFASPTAGALRYDVTYQTLTSSNDSSFAYDSSGGSEMALLAEPSTSAQIVALALPAGTHRLFAYVIDDNNVASAPTPLGLITVQANGTASAGSVIADYQSRYETATRVQQWDVAAQLANVLSVIDSTQAGCEQLASNIATTYTPTQTAYTARAEAQVCLVC
jgi:hypothetical protein